MVAIHHHLDDIAPIPPNAIRVLHRAAVRVGNKARACRAEAMVPVQGKAWWALLAFRNQRDSVQHEKIDGSRSSSKTAAVEAALGP